MLENIKLIDLCEIALKAGQQILEVYESDFAVETKEDKSPLTLADKKSHEAIVENLEVMYPNIPILSEEGNHLSYEERVNWEYLWIVDPLDGTKEFVKRNGEFTVNIALVHNGTPVAGVIYTPVIDTMYVAKAGVGALKLEGYSKEKHVNDEALIDKAIRLNVEKMEKKAEVSVVASRSHLSKETEDYIEEVKGKYGEATITSAGSSLKLCLVAEGKADVYPRFAPTMEWDTCAGQAIVELAGGKVIRVDNNEPLRYNREDLLNPWFIAMNGEF